MDNLLAKSEETLRLTYPIISKGKYVARILYSTTIPDSEFFNLVYDEDIDSLVAVEDKRFNVHLCIKPNYPVHEILDTMSIELDRLEDIIREGMCRSITLVVDKVLKQLFDKRDYVSIYKFKSSELYLMKLDLREID